MDKLTKDALHKVLQNVTGKSIADKHYETTLDVLNAYNALYECVLTFALTPSTATVVLKQGTTVIQPNEDGTYSVKEGTYTYDVSNVAYTSKLSQALTITNADETTGSKTETVSLNKIVPDYITAKAVLVGGEEISIVDSALTMVQNSVLDYVEAKLNIGVTLNGTPGSYVTIGGQEYPHGLITVDETDNTIIYVTPTGTNGQVPNLGVVTLRVPADAIRTVASQGNAEKVITLTVVAGE